MALRNILTKEDKTLYKTSRPVTDFNKRLHVLLDDMKETLEEANGAGLAAPQVGILRRAVVVVDQNGEMLELVNPEIIEEEGTQNGLEGCLSVPGVFGLVERPEYVKVRAYDRDGNQFEADGHGIVARAFCHEISHLDGHLFTEFVSRILTEEEIDEMMSKQDDEEEEK